MGHSLFKKVAKKAIGVATLPGRVMLKKGIKDATYFARHPDQIKEFASKVSKGGAKGLYEFGVKHYEGPFAKQFHAGRKKYLKANQLYDKAKEMKNKFIGS